ncbi:MAG: TonB family protein [Blastocatellia bacterium]
MTQHTQPFLTVVSALLALLCLFPSLGGVQQQSNAPGNAQAQSQTKTPEAVEAEKLNAEVVRLFRGEKFAEALPLAKRALELCEKVSGPEHPLTQSALKNLAAVNMGLKKYGAAAEAYQRLLKVQEKLHGQEDLSLCDTLSDLGWSRFYNREAGRAEEAYTRSLKILEKAYAPGDLKTVPALRDLASLYHGTGRFSQAIVFYRRMIAIYEKQPHPAGSDLAELLVKCAALLREENKNAEAEQYETRARTMYAAMNARPATVPVSGGILQGMAILRRQPEYPLSAKQSHVQGMVQVLIEVDEAGIVTSAKAVRGPSELYLTSEQAARQWRFRPTLLEGRPVKVSGVLTFNFTL